MGEIDREGWRASPATIALSAATVLAIGALTYRFVFHTEGNSAPAETNKAAAANPAPNLDASIASLTERLRQDPDNHEGWYLLGLAWREARRFAEAEQAFRRAMELAPAQADYRAYLGEALLLRDRDGSPPVEAETQFRRALALAPGHPQARYYLATMRDLRGEHRQAIDDLIGLLRDAPPDAPWQAQVRDAAIAIARQNRIDIAGRLPPPAASPPSTATAAIPGPSREQMAAAQAIPPSQQDAMVRSMVDRLATRLRSSPRDAEGWIRLMRSRMVLGEVDAAHAALRSGLSAFADDAAVQRRLRAAAAELGVPAA